MTADMTPPIHPPCVLLAGGPSAERDVSLRTGDAVEAALTRLDVSVRRFDPADGSLDGCDFAGGEIAFLALHGTYGEDGTVQRELADRGVAFTGDGEAASQLAFDKWATRAVVAAAGVRVAEGSLATDAADWDRFPCVVKPRRQGSSVGLHLCATRSELLAAVVGDPAETLIEALVPDEEFTVGLVNGRLLPPVRVRPPGELFDANAKYADPRSEFTPLTDAADRRFGALHEAAAAAFAAVGVVKLGRADFIVPSDGPPVFLEVNTLPGMTERSLLPIAWEAAGGTFDSLVATILAGATP